MWVLSRSGLIAVVGLIPMRLMARSVDLGLTRLWLQRGDSPEDGRRLLETTAAAMTLLKRAGGTHSLRASTHLRFIAVGEGRRRETRRHMILLEKPGGLLLDKGEVLTSGEFYVANAAVWAGSYLDSRRTTTKGAAACRRVAYSAQRDFLKRVGAPSEWLTWVDELEGHYNFLTSEA